MSNLSKLRKFMGPVMLLIAVANFSSLPNVFAQSLEDLETRVSVLEHELYGSDRPEGNFGRDAGYAGSRIDQLESRIDDL